MPEVNQKVTLKHYNLINMNVLIISKCGETELKDNLILMQNYVEIHAQLLPRTHICINNLAFHFLHQNKYIF